MFKAPDQKTYCLTLQQISDLADLVAWFDTTPESKNHKAFISLCHGHLMTALGDDKRHVYAQADKEAA